MYGSYGYISAVDMPLLVVSMPQLSVSIWNASTKVTNFDKQCITNDNISYFTLLTNSLLIC